MSETEKLFKESKYQSYKFQKYFKVYDELFTPYKNKKITFVEIGILNGGSLFIWKNFFGENARIIGIDMNPECKKFEKEGFEIFIGDQSDPLFWESFFKKVGNVDIILDDGGHTNNQQVTTVTSCLKNINDGGIVVVEDTHTSYMTEFSNPQKYSFINFSKKLIDDLNLNAYFKSNKYKYSYNKYIYSIRYYEGIAAFMIDQKLCIENTLLDNNWVNDGKSIFYGHKDYRYGGDSKLVYLKKIHIIRKLITKMINLRNIISNKFETLKIKKFFK
tara:strand:+ start:3450 stop:4271 length:822 start_codon:yes stop_codon:yes gene_type:complete